LTCKIWTKNYQPFGKKTTGGGFFLTHTVGINNIFGEGHTIGDMYKPKASKYSKTWNI